MRGNRHAKGGGIITFEVEWNSGCGMVWSDM
jgi:hypothetical protein